MFVVNKRRRHSLKITITFHHHCFEFAIWEMVSTRLHEKPWKPHRFWVNLRRRRANWIGFSYLSTSILCTTQIFQVHCTLAQLPTVPNTYTAAQFRMYIKRNVTWTNKSSCRRWVVGALQRKKKSHSGWNSSKMSHLDTLSNKHWIECLIMDLLHWCLLAKMDTKILSN